MERVKKLFVNKIFKGGLVLTLSTLVSQGLAFFLAFYFANEMGNQGFGDFTLYMQVLSVINIVGSLNLNACVIRGRHEFEDNYRSFFYTISILGTVSIVAISGLFFFVLKFGLVSFYLILAKIIISIIIKINSIKISNHHQLNFIFFSSTPFITSSSSV